MADERFLTGMAFLATDTCLTALLKGEKPDVPPLAIDAAFRRPQREDRTERDQGTLLRAGLDTPVAAVPTRGKGTRLPAVAAGDDTT